MRRGDGRLNHDLDPGEKRPQDACGVFGVWAPGEQVAKLTYFGLYALQHRGQEAAGIAVSDGSSLLVYKELGLVSQVFDEATLATLQGHIAVGHTRYSTTGSTTWENAQPSFRTTPAGTGLALGHNGNLVNTVELFAQARADGVLGDAQGATTDSDLLTALLAARPDVSVEQAAMDVLPTLQGAFSLVFMDEHTLYAARDPQGVRPLVLGRLERGWIVTSETAALDIVGASFVREIEPGEMLAIDDDGLRSQRFANPDPKGCLFEYVYLARPDTTISGRSVHSTRVELGRRLAKEHPAEADLVIPVPESGTPAAIGYAEASGIPYGTGLVKNSYVGRTFIQPSQTIRQLGIRLKLNPLRDVIRGKRLVVVDDTIVRGNTQRALVRMLREAGAVEVHVRISAPAGEVAVLLRHRLRVQGRAGRERPRRRGHPPLDRRRLARLRVAGQPDRGQRAAQVATVPRVLRRRVPDRAAGHRRQACPRGHREGCRARARARPGVPRRGRPRPGHDDRYSAAGVDIEAGDRAVELMKASVRRTGRPGVLGGLGGFAGLFSLDLEKYPQPVLASSTDGVGTKIAIAQALDRHDTIGIDLVAMVVDDLVVVGAEPLFLSDYIATGKVVPERIAAIVSGIAEGCVRAGCALVGGETAEHPGLMAPDEYDVSGTGVGVVNADAVLGPERVQPGDV